MGRDSFAAQEGVYLKISGGTLNVNSAGDGLDSNGDLIIEGGTIFVSGQNLLCITDYLGMDPEFAYSNSAAMMGVDYGKVALPKSVKIGFNLKF
jgi:hypothetical protein